MTIRALSRQEFERFSPTGAAPDDRNHKAVEWFADDAGLLYGTIESDLDCSFRIVRRDIHGKFHMLHLETGCRDVGHARRLLFEKMASVLATGGSSPSAA